MNFNINNVTENDIEIASQYYSYFLCMPTLDNPLQYDFILFDEIYSLEEAKRFMLLSGMICKWQIEIEDDKLLIVHLDDVRVNKHIIKNMDMLGYTETCTDSKILYNGTVKFKVSAFIAYENTTQRKCQKLNVVPVKDVSLKTKVKLLFKKS